MTAVTQKKLVSVVFSFRNEEENIDELIRRTRLAMDEAGVEHEMVFVNDDSNDRSMEILRGYCARDSRVKVITMSRRFGVSPCALAGFAYARGDAVIYMDADLQDPPELIPQLVQEWLAGADVVNTTRTKRHGENSFKMWVTRIGYRLINSVSTTDIPMDTGDYKLLSRRVVDQLVALREYDPFLRGLVRWVGFKQVQIFYEREARFGGVTHVPLLGGAPLRALINGIASFSAAPLYVAFVVGAIISTLSLLYLLFIVVTTLFLHMNLPGWPAQMVTILFLGGVTLFTIGIQGVYVGRMYEELKRRPNYIVADELNIHADQSTNIAAKQQSNDRADP